MPIGKLALCFLAVISFPMFVMLMIALDLELGGVHIPELIHSPLL